MLQPLLSKQKANKYPWHVAWEVILAFLSLPPICLQFSDFLLAAINIRGLRDAPHPAQQVM